MSFLAITVVGGKYQVYSTTDGRDRHYIGPTWPTPKSAATYIDTLEGRNTVSPLRAPVESSALPSEVSAGSLTRP